MPTRTVILFDASPLVDPTPWMKQASAATGIFLVDMNAVSEVMAKDPETRSKLLAKTTPNEDPAMGPYYLRALDKVAGNHAKVIAQSVSWILFGVQPALCVLDFDHLNDERARAKTVGITAAEYDALAQSYRTKIDERVKKTVPKDHVLAVSAGASEAQKAEQAIAFIKKLVK